METAQVLLARSMAEDCNAQGRAESNFSLSLHSMLIDDLSEYMEGWPPIGE